MWLIHSDIAQAMNDARAAGVQPSAEQLSAFNAPLSADGADPRIMRRAGATVEIRIEGALTKKPDVMAAWFGGGNTTYADIQTSLAIAQSDPSVKSVVLYVDSPGGQVDGLFDTLAAIESFRGSGKKLSVSASQAQSAAYAIAAMAGPIEATGPAAQFGSVGVVATFLQREDVLTLTNTDSPDKRPDLSTDEGKAVVVRYLDAVNDLFVDAIARGRGVNAKSVTESFGRGSTLLASQAKAAGMIDSIAKPKSVPRAPSLANAQVQEDVPTAAAGGTGKDKKMTEDELRAQYPQLHAAVFASGVAEGDARGEARERDRVCAHLTMGTQSGAIETAHGAIRSGATMTQTLTAEYLTAGMNRADRNIRQAESDAVGAAVDGLPQASDHTPPDLGDQVVAILRGGKVGE